MLSNFIKALLFIIFINTNCYALDSFVINEKTSLFSANYMTSPMIQSSYVGWKAGWEWAGTSITPEYQYQQTPYSGSTFSGRVDNLDIDFTGEVVISDKQIDWIYQWNKKADFPNAIGFGVDFKIKRFLQGSEEPILLPDNKGWSWQTPNGQTIEVTFTPALAEVSFVHGKSMIRTLFFTGISQGTQQTTMTVKASNEVSISGPVLLDYDASDLSQWHKDLLPKSTSPIDLSFLNDDEKPAGKHGFIKADKDKLIFEDNSPAEFWGTNVIAYSLISSSDSNIETHAKRIAKLGYNLVRIHHHDSSWVRPNIFENPTDNTLVLSTESLRKIDLWIKYLKDEGVYIWLDLHVGRTFTENDDIDDFDDFAKGKDRAEGKGFNYYNESIWTAMQVFNDDYLSHFNPYTGLAYKDDPAVISVLITNENDLTQHFGNALLADKNVPIHNAIFSEDVKQFSETHGLNEVKVGQTWLMGESKIYLNDVEHRFNQKMISHLNGLGVKSLIATTNSWGGMGLFGLPSLTDGSIVDAHSYGRAEEFKFNPRFNPGFLSWVGAAQVTGKPLSVTEWNIEPFPARDRFVTPIFTASIAKLQGWDAIMQYGYGQDTNWGTRGSNYSSHNDPGMMALVPAAALLFRQNHVAEANNLYELKLNKNDFFFARQDPRTSKSIRTLLETSRFTIGMPETTELPWLNHNVDNQNAVVINDANQDFIPAGQDFVESDTQELKRDWNTGIHTINTPKSQIASGWIGGKVITLDDVRFNLVTNKAVVAVQSLENKPINESSNILISIMARSQPSNGINSVPFLSEPTIGQVSIQAPEGLKLFPINNDAHLGKQIIMNRAGGEYIIDFTPNMKTHWFKLQNTSVPFRIISPQNDALFSYSEPVTIKTNGSDLDQITHVNFLNAMGDVLETVLDAPYEYTTSDLPSGNHSIVAEATYNDGTTASETITFSIGEIPFEIISPLNGDSFATGTPVVIKTNASAISGNIKTVHFWLDNWQWIGERDIPPYELTTSGLSVGEHIIRSRLVYQDDTFSSALNKTIVIGDNVTIPAVSNIQLSTTETSVTITWDTDVLSDSTVNYSVNDTYGMTKTDSSMVTSHSITLEGLVANTEYQYRVISTDASGVSSLPVDLTFTTAQTIDATAPVINDIQVTVTDTSAVVTWNTNEAASSAVSYGLDTGYGSITDFTELVISHSIELTNLLPATNYQFQISSTDSSANTSLSTELTFTTSNSSISSCSKGLELDGINDWVNIPDLTLADDFTIEGWFKLAPGIDYRDVLFGQEGAGPDIHFSSGRVRLYVYGIRVTAKTPLIADTWGHIAITRSGADLKVYVNGVEDATGRWNGILKIKAIGRGNRGYYGGMMDEIRIWDIARSGAEISAGYDAEVDPNTLGLIGYWNFNGTEQIITDISNAQNHGSLGANTDAGTDDPVRLDVNAPFAENCAGGSVNTAPIANQDTVGPVKAGESISFTVTENDADSDGELDPSSVVIVSGPDYGTATVNTLGEITYVNNGDTALTDTLSYTVYDTEGLISNVATVSINITALTPTNTPPVANNDTVGSVEAGGTIHFTVTGNDVDSEDNLNPVSVVIVSEPIDGMATVDASGEITYQNYGDAVITDTLSYTVADSEGLISNVATVSIAITESTPNNELPVTQADTAQVQTGAEVVIQVLANDNDSDGTLDKSSLIIVDSPVFGDVTIDNEAGTIAYTHNGSETSSDSFVYTVNDNEGGVSNEATVSITIVNSASSCSKGLELDGINDWVNIPDLTLADDFTIEGWFKLAPGIDYRDVLFGQEGAGPDIHFSSGRVRLYVYGIRVTAKTPLIADTWGHIAITRSGADLKVYVNGVEDATGRWNGILKIKAIGRGNRGYYGGMMDEIRIWDIARSGAEISAGYDAEVDPNTLGLIGYWNFNGTEQIITDISNAQNHGSLGANTDAGTDDPVRLDVNAPFAENCAGGSVNTAPIANQDTVGPVKAGESISFTVTENDADSDGELDPSSVVIVSGPDYGTATVNTLGEITYVNNGDTALTDTLSYTVYDTEGLISNVATVSINITALTPTNTPPVANNDTVGSVEAGGTIHFTVTGNDVDSEDNLNPVSVVIVSEPIDGMATVDASGEITYQNYGDAVITDTLSYTVADSEGLISNVATVSIAITESTPNNELPVTQADTAQVQTGAEVVIQVLANDNDSDGTLDKSSLIIVDSPVFGDVTIDNEAGTIAYTHNGSETSSDSFVYTVNDNEGGVSNEATVSITIVNSASSCSKGLELDGINDWVNIPDLTLADDFTIEGWFKLAPGIDYRDVLFGQEGAGPDIHFSSGRVRLYVYGIRVTAKTPLIADTWGHIAITRSGTDLKVYVNGVEDATGRWNGILKIKAIGRGNRGYYGGMMDEIRIWDIARSGAEISAGYEAEVDPNTLGLIGYWNFNGTEQIITDISNAQNNGSLGANTDAGTDDPVRLDVNAPFAENCM